MTTAVQRRFPVGAELLNGGGVHFRVWAPRRRRLAVVVEDGRVFELDAEENGYFSGFVDALGAGALYRFRLDGTSELYPDPASRFQPAGPHGPSEVIDASTFEWTDAHWPGVRLPGQVIYEMHIGSFTESGSWGAAVERLPELADLGATLIEVMPVADFPGRFGWGYDGVNLFAPCRLYGRPDDFRKFVNEAHRLGVGVILDVVYNHLGPDGNYLKEFSLHYFSKRYETEWGEALNFDGPDCQHVREFVVTNARYWIEEFHLDGLRLDATQQVFDASKENIIAELTRRVREVAHGRSILIVGENECQQARLVRPVELGGCGLDALWNDDFHHAARVAATGRDEAYFSDYRGTPQEIISALKWGFLYQGQYYSWQDKMRGAPATDVPGPAFILYLQNHDQVANSCRGERLHMLTSPGVYRALTAVLLLAPGTPLLFQGQEFAASSPFFYFADHHPGLAELVEKGRRDFLSQFPSIANAAAPSLPPAPHDEQAFLRSKLDHRERERNSHILNLHRDLLKLRREDPVFSQQRTDWMHGAVLGFGAFALRLLTESGDDRLIVVNLGKDYHPASIAEPLLAPPAGRCWDVLWSSDAAGYAGCAAPPVDLLNRWRISAHSAVVLRAVAYAIEDPSS